MDTTDKFAPKGVVKLDIYKDGALVEAYEDRNLIVLSGRNAATALIGAATAGKAVDRYAVGTNGAETVLTDTAITAPFNKAVAGITYPSGAVQFSFTLELAENNGVTIREFGLLCVDGTLFARIVRAPIIKDNTVRIEGTWTITF
jgi:hypothetical protein